MKYKLIWRGEVIDYSKDWVNAQYLAAEYRMAYGGAIHIMKNNHQDDSLTDVCELIGECHD